jgi:hypothetical protein
MQALLAKAYFKSGQKNDAADAASAVLKRYPYCLDANRVLTEILGIDRPESAEIYRRRVYELDPYAAQVDGSVFQSSEVSDEAVTLEQLDWNGQPTGMSSDWGTTRAIGLGSGASDEQPDWLKNALPETTSTPPSTPAFAFEEDASSSPESDPPAQPAEDIPDFLRAAGWGESTDAFDESKSSAMFDDEPVSEAQPIEQGDMPDWVKAMAPQEREESRPADKEEIPDWISKIGTDELPVPAADSSSDDQPDWLSGLSEESSDLETPSADADESSLFDQPDSEDEPDSSSLLADDLDFLNAVKTDEPESTDLSSEERSDMPDESGNLGMGEEEQDDSFAWLENLAAKQGATEGLLTKPEERLEDEPDWIKQAKGLSESPSQKPAEERRADQDIPTDPIPAMESSNVEGLGKSDEEQDDSFSWLENLAVKQGATEGLLTKPEERLEEEPDWIKQAKGAEVSAEPSPVQDTDMQEDDAVDESVAQPTLDTSELGKSDEERDDSFSWLENLAVKQGATEGLLTKPEERREDEPEWVKQAKNSAVSEPSDEPSSESELVAKDPDDMSWMKDAGEDGEEILDVPVWVADDHEVETTAEFDARIEDKLAEIETASENEDADAWLKTLEEPESEQEPEQDQTPVSVLSEDDDMMAWMEQRETPVEVSEVSESEAVEESDDLPDWLSGLDEDESKPAAVTASDGLPSWMTDDTGELVAEPTKIEPTRPTDWASEEQTKAEKVEEVEETAPPPTPVPVPDTRQSAPELESAPEPVAEKRPAPRKKDAKPAAPPPEPYKEPVTRKNTGMLEMPVDPVLGSARAELGRSNIPGALETYGKLIKKGRFLEEVIYDLRDALYRYPVEVSIWQSLGDAYMRANQLQDALDAYTKAEELLR